jgi:hypothetical protein
MLRDTSTHEILRAYPLGETVPVGQSGLISQSDEIDGATR